MSGVSDASSTSMLRECPFCLLCEGKVESLLDDVDEPATVYSVRCQYCDARGPSADSKREAVVEWNNRTPRV